MVTGNLYALLGFGSAAAGRIRLAGAPKSRRGAWSRRDILSLAP